MQSYDLLPNPTLISPNPHLFDYPAMDDAISVPIHGSSGKPESNGDTSKPETNNNSETEMATEAKESNLIEEESNKELSNDQFVGSKSNNKNGKKESNTTTKNKDVVGRRERPTRACTIRPAKYVDPPIIERRPRLPKKEKVEKVVVADEAVEDEVEEEEEEEEESNVKCSKVVTPLVNTPTLDQIPRWNLRSMWELASILNFFHVFREVLNITAEFSAEELESALLTPNSTLNDVHIPLLKAIPPVIRMACGPDTWVTVLCKKLRDWWHWVAEGELPIVADHGAEIETYKKLDPGVRVVILKALCDIRVEQDDIRSYIENSLKHGAQLFAFRKERIGGDSHGVSYWYEDDEFVGHRLYRETRKVEKKVEGKKVKTKGSHVLPSTTYEWETVATNLDEFLEVSEKLLSSKNRTEVSLAKKLKNDMLSEIEKIQKRKEKLLKKQQRQALLLDNFFALNGLGGGRSLRERKSVTYTFDDFDRSINEAIKITKRKQPSPEPGIKREVDNSEPSSNGRWNGSSHTSLAAPSPVDNDEMDVDDSSEPLDNSNRRRQRSQRYSAEDFVEADSDTEEYFNSDDDIVGEAVYDDEYMQQRKKRLTSSSEGEGDEEYSWSEENGEDEVEEEEEDSPSDSEDSGQPRGGRFKKLEGRTRRGTKIRSVDDLDSGLRRSKRAMRNRIDYRKYEQSDSDTETTMKPRNASVVSESRLKATDNAEYSMESQDSDDVGNVEERQQRDFRELTSMDVEIDEIELPRKSRSPKDDSDGIGATRGFLDLNELAPGSGFDDPSTLVKDDDQKDE